jgi:hypothetical protein
MEPEPPMKDQPAINFNQWKDAISKQLVGELEEVKETSGIEI